MYHASSIRRVRSPCSRPATMRPRMSSSIPSANVAPLPPARSSTFSYSPRSSEHPPYGPSIITVTGTPSVSSSGAQSGSSGAGMPARASAFSERDQSPAARTPSGSVSRPTTPAAASTERAGGGRRGERCERVALEHARAREDAEANVLPGRPPAAGVVDVDERHLVVRRAECRVLDPVAQQADDEVRRVERDGRVDPRRGVRRVHADEDEERRVRHDAARLGHQRVRRDAEEKTDWRAKKAWYAN
jgi:hypothetical protein